MQAAVTRLDHLGIVAGLIKELGIIELVDERLTSDVREEISTGEAVAAMIINGLGFTTKPLCLTPEFFTNKPLELLFRQGVEAEHFNRSKLGRVLDSFFEYGCSNLFFEIAAKVCIQEKVEVRFNSLDTTSLSVHGEYENGEEGSVHITHGYSKEHRMDLKQVVQELLVSQDGGVPIAMRVWDGNANDNEIFKERSHELITKFKSSEVPRYLIADSKLYTKENCSNLPHLQFITRIPRSNKEERNVVAWSFIADKWVKLDNKDSYQEHEVVHNGISQRWIVVKSGAANKRAQVQLKKIKDEELKKAQKFQASVHSFACEGDATKALKLFSKGIHYHEVVAKITPDGDNGYQVGIKLECKEEKVAAEIKQRSCYTLGTNISREALSGEEVIAAYKKQNQSIENTAFRFLKDPVFFTSSFFLKKNSRIEALLCIMTLSLLVYAIAQRRARSTLQQQGGTIPNQIKKPINNPTARWLFQLMDAINIVTLKTEEVAHTIIEGINELKMQIVSLFGEAVRQIYAHFANNFSNLAFI